MKKSLRIKSLILGAALLLTLTACTPIWSITGRPDSNGGTPVDNPGTQNSQDPQDPQDQQDPPDSPEAGTPFAKHGKLYVNGTQLTDKNNKPYQLYGFSTHGIAWFPQYVNKETFKSMRDIFNTNCVRIAMYSAEYGGYTSGGNQQDLKTMVSNSIDYATELGMYVIVDWHILQDSNPQTHQTEAIEFFTEITKKYGSYQNVLYEICNEPNNGTTWQNISDYANTVIPVIRKNAPDSIILVGTPSWCQELDKVKDHQLNFSNLMYNLHFYADTHKNDLRNLLSQTISNGIPVFVSEFGTCDASGNGGFNETETNKWFTLLDQLNVSYMNWSFSNKSETASVLKSSCSKTSDFTDQDLTESGLLVKNHFLGKAQ